MDPPQAQQAFDQALADERTKHAVADAGAVSGIAGVLALLAWIVVKLRRKQHG